jgi:hypothetical protein
VDNLLTSKKSIIKSAYCRKNRHKEKQNTALLAEEIQSMVDLLGRSKENGRLSQD